MVDNKNLKLGAVVGAVSMLLAYIFGTLLKEWGAKITFATMDINVRSQLEAGIGETEAGGLAERLLSYMSGIIPTDFSGYLIVFVAGFLIVVAGKVALDLLKQKATLFKIMLAGTLVLTILIQQMSVLSLTFVSTAITLAIYFAIVGFAVKVLIDKKIVPSGWVQI